MLHPRTTFYITVFTFLSLLHPILSNPVPTTLVAPDDHGTSGRTSYSGQVDESTLSPTRAARLGFEDMKKQHKDKEPSKEPSIMSSLQISEKMFLASSVKGGFPSYLNRDPEHVHTNVQEHLRKCEQVHGGKHGTGANCGEVHAASKFFRDNPDKKHIEGGKFVAFGHPFGNKARKGDVVPPCTGSGKHNWGCKQFVKSVTRPLDRSLTPIPSRAGADAKGKVPAGGKSSPLRAGAMQAEPSSFTGGKPSLGGKNPGEKPRKDQNGQQPLNSISNNSPLPQAEPKKSKAQPGQSAPQGPPQGRPAAPPKQRPEPQPQRPGPLAPLSPSSARFKSPSPPKVRPTSPAGDGSGKSSSTAPSSPRPPKDHPPTPPPPPSQRPVSALTQKQQSSRPPQHETKQQQKVKAPTSVPKPSSGSRPPAPPPPAGRPPSPPPISRPVFPSPPPSARPASPPWQVAGKKGGKGRNGKRDVELTRALVRRALVRRALVRRAGIVREG